jgi:NADPH:quinone reductase-like Zn-dependent oxidoreductase
MRAAVRDRYGPPEQVVEVRDVEQPVPNDDEVLVRVGASSVNPADWYSVVGTPFIARLGSGLRKPKDIRLGVDFAGQVEAVGSAVTRFRPGDEVFGGRSGALAEYVCVPEGRGIVPKPANLTFEQAAAVPVAALTALQGLRDKGHLKSGQRVLVNGASGGVGTCSVQMATALGAEVTGVCNTDKVDLVRSIGADHVIDYTRQDFTVGEQRYDLLFDVAGSRRWRELRKVLTSDGTLVIVGAPKGGRILGPLAHALQLRVAAALGRRRATFFIAKFNKPDMETIQGLLEAGSITPVVDRQYELSRVADAFRYLEEGHARGKIVVTM